MAVDDVQWLDPDTARALAFAMRRLDGHPVGVIATMRTPLTAPEPLGLERALGRQRYVRARLGALDLDALRVLLESLGYWAAASALARARLAAAVTAAVSVCTS